MEDVEIPSSSSFLNSRKDEARKRFAQTIDEFKKLLSDKTHPDNQTQAYQNNEKSILSRMLSSADELDKVFPGEGFFGLIAINLRTSLKLKGELIKMEVRMRELEMEVKRLKTKPNSNSKN